MEKKMQKRFWKKGSQKLELLGNPLLEAPRSWNFWGFCAGGAQKLEFLGLSAGDESRNRHFWAWRLVMESRSWSFWACFAAGDSEAGASDACDALKFTLLAGRDLEARASGA